MNIFISNLSYGVKDADLNQLFSEYGEISSAKVIMDKQTGNSKRYGFVEFDNDEEGHAAIAELNEKDFQGNQIVVKIAQPKPAGQ